MSRLYIPTYGFDLSYRPRTYWEHDDAISAITANIKGTLRREMVVDVLTAEGAKRSLYEAAIGSLDSSFLESEAEPELKRSLGLIHPSWMGGEYLPDYLRGEVEIARVELKSSTADVYSVRARRATRTSRIRYRIVDEYPEYGPWTVRIKSSALPLTFRNIVKLIDTARSAMTEVVPEEGNVTDGIRDYQILGGSDAEQAAEFVTFRSSVYPQLSAYYAKRAEVWLNDWLRDNREDDEEGDEDDEGDGSFDDDLTDCSRP
jgi:hypothetical protein